MKNFRKVLGILIIIVVVAIVFRGIFRLISSRDRVEQAELRLSELQLEQKELKAMLDKVSSDYYKEEQIRDKLGMAREGEIVVVLPSEDVLRRLSPRILEKEEIKLLEPNWRKWVELFLDI